MPDDVHLFVRNHGDIPVSMKEEVMRLLREKGWKETTIPDPTLLSDQVIRVRSG